MFLKPLIAVLLLGSGMARAASWDERRATNTPILFPDYAAVEASTFARSMRMADLVAKGDRACVYAELVDTAAPVDLPVATDQKHMAFVRSMTRLE